MAPSLNKIIPLNIQDTTIITAVRISNITRLYTLLSVILLVIFHFPNYIIGIRISLVLLL
jgi:hypothetical protein